MFLAIANRPYQTQTNKQKQQQEKNEPQTETKFLRVGKNPTSLFFGISRGERIDL